jgi:hypothetical protein
VILEEGKESTKPLGTLDVSKRKNRFHRQFPFKVAKGEALFFPVVQHKQWL